MNNLLLLLVFMGQLKALEPDYQQKVLVSLAKRDSIAPRNNLKGGGGGSGKAERTHRVLVQQLVVPTNPPVNCLDIALTGGPLQISRIPNDARPNISIGMNQKPMDVGELRSRIEAQNIDIINNRSCWDRFMDYISGCCGSRIRPLSPPRLERQLSYYPGRYDTPDAFSSK